MVFTQLQLKWPNHSTHLLTRLKYLFKNEQLVDCTLMCNKHSLKVHRSVLAACSPYFERELENNPFIVIKDMQFNVLQALIEFMYFGETRITEENLTSLIEAAKLFEVKGLCEMDLLSSNENSIISSVIAVDSNCVVESSCITNKFDNITFENNSETINSDLKSHLQNHETLANNIHSEKYSHTKKKTNSRVLTENSNNFPTHSNRNFVVTPPQAESAQILLSLARSCSQKQYFDSNSCKENGIDNKLPCEKNADYKNYTNILINEHNLILNEASPVSSSDITNFKSLTDNAEEERLNNQNFKLIENNVQLSTNDIKNKIYDDDSSYAENIQYKHDNEETCNRDSLLAKLLTRNNQVPNSKSIQYDESFKNPYRKEFHPIENTNEANETDNNFLEKSKNFESTTNIILECPFLIETSDGYIDVPIPIDNINVPGNNRDIISTSDKHMMKIISQEDIVSANKYVVKDKINDHHHINLSCDDVGTSETSIDDPLHEVILERIKQDTIQSELKNDPEAVILCKVNENGKLEKYILSSNDINNLKEMNESLRRRKSNNPKTMVYSSSVAEYEVPLTNKRSSLITQIIDCGIKAENAISKLPFKKSGYVDLPVVMKNNDNNYVCTNDENVQLHDAPLSIDTHHHENMFEELDSQFNMNCSIENIQREYVAYEEASKNETQLEHNYYANAMKDEDEECIGISSSFDLQSVMMVEESINLNENNVAILSVNKNNIGKNNFNSSNTLQIISTQDLYLNNCENSVNFSNSQKNEIGNHIKIKSITDKDNGVINNKCDLTIKNKTFMNSILNVPVGKTKCNTNESASGFKTYHSTNLKRNSTENCFNNGNALPFKKVKSNVTTISHFEKKSKRVCRKRTTSFQADTINLNENCNINSINHSSSSNNNANNNSLIEEIIVDEIS